MILDLLKKAIKENNIKYVREAYKIISGKEFVTSTDIQTVIGNQVIESKTDDGFIISKKRNKQKVVNTGNKFNPNEYEENSGEETPFVPPVPRTRTKVEDITATCHICRKSFKAISGLEEKICNDCITKNKRRS